MALTLTTPALLFPAISLLFLAYSNRFLALSSLVRDLLDRWERKQSPGIPAQIESLKRRLRIIKRMQLLGVFCFFLMVLTMLFLFLGLNIAAEVAFALGLALLLASLAMSIHELFISADALNILLDGEERLIERGGK